MAEPINSGFDFSAGGAVKSFVGVMAAVAYEPGVFCVIGVFDVIWTYEPIVLGELGALVADCLGISYFGTSSFWDSKRRGILALWNGKDLTSLAKGVPSSKRTFSALPSEQIELKVRA